MAKNETIKGRITIPAETWQKFKKLSEEKNALEREIKGMESTFPLPVPSEETAGTYLVVDGNGDEQGKLSIFHYPGCQMPEGYRKRLS